MRLRRAPDPMQLVRLCPPQLGPRTEERVSLPACWGASSQGCTQGVHVDKLPWERLPSAGVTYQIDAEGAQLLATARADEAAKHWMTGPDGEILASLSQIAAATSRVAGLDPISKSRSTFGTPAPKLEGYLPRASAEPRRPSIPSIGDIHRHMGRHHQHMARLDELGRLQARDEHAARGRSNRAPVLRLVTEITSSRPASANQQDAEELKKSTSTGSPEQTKRRRSDPLTSVIQSARQECTDSSSTAAVFVLLRSWATQSPRRPPFVGVSDTGLKWLDSNDELQELSSKALGQRLKRLGKLSPEGR